MRTRYISGIQSYLYTSNGSTLHTLQTPHTHTHTNTHMCVSVQNLYLEKEVPVLARTWTHMHANSRKRTHGCTHATCNTTTTTRLLCTYQPAQLIGRTASRRLCRGWDHRVVRRRPDYAVRSRGSTHHRLVKPTKIRGSARDQYPSFFHAQVSGL